MSFFIKGQKVLGIVTKVEDKGEYAQIRFTTSRKDKKSGKAVKSYFSFWNLRGTAMEGLDKLQERLENAPTFNDSSNKMGVMIVIKSFSFQQEKYENREGETVYSKQPFFTIWDWDFYTPEKKDGKSTMDEAPQVEESESSRDENPFIDDDDLTSEEDDIFGEE